MARPLAAAVVLTLACAFPGQAAAEKLTDLPTSALATNGPVTNLLRLGDTVYVRGDFTKVGTYSGSGVALDPATGARDPRYPTFNGQVSDVLPDGAGGWYVGGDFGQVNGGNTPRHLAHVMANGRLDGSFRPEVNGFVDSLATDGETLFIGGYFTRVGGKRREHVAAVDRETGALVESFNATQENLTTELAYVAASGDRGARLFVGDTERLLALDPATGDDIPEFNGPISGEVRSLALIGERLYVGGGDIIALDVRTGTEDPAFAPDQITLRSGDFDPGRYHVLLPDGDRLLAGGGFTALGGDISSLVALDPLTGKVDPDFAPHIDGDVYDLARFDGVLWAGGRFKSAEEKAATNLVAVNATTGARDLALAPRLDGNVYALATGDMLFAGGEIALAGYSARRGYAALQASSGALHPTVGADAHFRYSPYADYAATSGRLFAGTQNSTEAGGPLFTESIRAFDARGGVPASSPRPVRVKGLMAFAVDERRIFSSQALDRSFYPESRISVRRATTGSLIDKFTLPLRGYVTSVEPNGNHLFVAGSFKRTRPSGQKANIAVVKVNLETGKIVDGFDPHVNGPVYDMTAGGGRLIISGIFSKVGPKVNEIKRPGFAAVSTQSGTADRQFDPALYGGHYRRLDLMAGTLYTTSYSFASGAFLNADTAARLRPPELARGTPVWAAERAGRRLFVAVNPAAPARFFDHAEIHAVLQVKAPR